MSLAECDVYLQNDYHREDIRYIYTDYKVSISLYLRTLYRELCQARILTSRFVNVS